MKAIILNIEGVEYAFPDRVVVSLIGNIFISYLTDSECNFKSPYGECIIKHYSLKEVIEFVNNDLNKFIAVLLENGIKKEQLPIWPNK